MYTGRLVVKPYRPWRSFFRTTFLVGALAGVAYFAYLAYASYPQWSPNLVAKLRGVSPGTPAAATAAVAPKGVSTEPPAPAESRPKPEAPPGLATSLRATLPPVGGDPEAENRALREQVAVLERAAQVEKEAYGKVDEHLRELQAEILNLKEELAFYRDIVSSGDGLGIQGLEIQREGSGEEYRYRLVLTGNLKDDRVNAGTVTLAVAGEHDGRLQQLWMSELAGIRFEFKYFQTIRGRLTLPEGFVPHGMIVQVTEQGALQPTLEKTFDWPLAAG